MANFDLKKYIKRLSAAALLAMGIGAATGADAQTTPLPGSGGSFSNSQTRNNTTINTGDGGGSGIKFGYIFGGANASTPPSDCATAWSLAGIVSVNNWDPNSDAKKTCETRHGQAAVAIAAYTSADPRDKAMGIGMLKSLYSLFSDNLDLILTKLDICLSGQRDGVKGGEPRGLTDDPFLLNSPKSQYFCAQTTLAQDKAKLAADLEAQRNYEIALAQASLPARQRADQVEPERKHEIELARINNTASNRLVDRPGQNQGNRIISVLPKPKHNGDSVKKHFNRDGNCKIIGKITGHGPNGVVPTPRQQAAVQNGANEAANKAQFNCP